LLIVIHTQRSDMKPDITVSRESMTLSTKSEGSVQLPIEVRVLAVIFAQFYIRLQSNRVVVVPHCVRVRGSRVVVI